MNLTFIFKIISIALLVPLILLGQETKKIVNKPNANSSLKEIYYVFKHDNTIRHGNYQQKVDKNTILKNGYYKNGLKDSLWTEYNWNGKIIVSIGHYKKGLKDSLWIEYSSNGKFIKSKGMFLEGKEIGVWEYFNNMGDLFQKYDFTNKELLFYKISDEDKELKYKAFKDSKFIEITLDRPPLYIGGLSLMYNSFHKNNLSYPNEAKQYGIEGTVYISFIISKTGKTFKHKIVKGIGYGCDEEALRVVKLVPERWLPGLLGDEELDLEIIIPVSFRIG
jgi:periplasmic protein TonB